MRAVLIRFDTDRIAELAAQTQRHDAEWDAVWSTVQARIAATVSEALDAYTGGSLEERAADYHRRTQQYNAQLQAQAAATAQVGDVAADTNAAMARAIAG